MTASGSKLSRCTCSDMLVTRSLLVLTNWFVGEPLSLTLEMSLNDCTILQRSSKMNQSVRHHITTRNKRKLWPTKARSKNFQGFGMIRPQKTQKIIYFCHAQSMQN